MLRLLNLHIRSVKQKTVACIEVGRGGRFIISHLYTGLSTHGANVWHRFVQTAEVEKLPQQRLDGVGVNGNAGTAGQRCVGVMRSQSDS